MLLFSYLSVFLFGLIIGSFLNAYTWRLQTGESAFQGRSYCPRCRHQLSWFDLIPLVSFVLLRGRCRYCGQAISWRYPLVELATAAVFVLLFWHANAGFVAFAEIGDVLHLFYLWSIASLLIVLFVYDLKHYILPDKVLFPAIGIALAYRAFEVLEIGAFAPLGGALFSALGAAGFFFLIFFFSQGRAMGFGDVKLALFMGLFLGWPFVVVALFCAFFLGALIGLMLIALQRKEFRSEIPFGPFLITGTFVAYLWGGALLDAFLAFSFAL